MLALRVDIEDSRVFKTLSTWDKMPGNAFHIFLHMQLLLCAATPFEIQPFVNARPDVNVLITGVGMTATTYALTKALASQKFSLIIQAGLAGSFDPSISLTDVVAVKTDCMADLGVEEKGVFKSVADLGLLEANKYPYNNNKLPNHTRVLNELGLSLVDAITVNEISTTQQRISYYRNKLEAAIESMEGAALHYVALQEKLSFVQIRAISNVAGERNKEKWKLNEAIHNLNLQLERIIAIISKQ